MTCFGQRRMNEHDVCLLLGGGIQRQYMIQLFSLSSATEPAELHMAATLKALVLE